MELLRRDLIMVYHVIVAYDWQNRHIWKGLLDRLEALTHGVLYKFPVVGWGVDRDSQVVLD